MTSTAVVTEDTTTIVAETATRFSWGIAIAGAVISTATTFFLLTLGSGVGLLLVSSGKSAGTFLTLGAVYFLAAQAFGFAVGGYMVGRLIGPEAENSAEEEFRAAAHGFGMWALAVVVSLLLVAIGATGAVTGLARDQAGSETSASSYWVDAMFRPAPNTDRVAADKAEAERILGANALSTSGSDRERLAALVSQDAQISMATAMQRVDASEARMRKAADDARKVASVASLWTAFALLFGAAVAIASAIAARWMDDRISFGFAARR